MASKKPTKTEIIAYLRDQFFTEDEWEEILFEIIRYRWRRMKKSEIMSMTRDELIAFVLHECYDQITDWEESEWNAQVVLKVVR